MKDLKLKLHFIHYLLFLLISGFGIFIFNYYNHNQKVQSWCVIATSIAYFFWGVFHHYSEKNLHLKVVLEYFLVALLGAVLIITLIYRA